MIKFKKNVKFDISATYDVETFFLLNDKKLKESKDFSDFQDIVNFSKNEEIEMSQKISKRAVEKLVRLIYDKNKSEICSRTAEIQKEWGKKEKNFIKLLNLIFKKEIVIMEEYILYPSIWSSFIRDFANNRISFPYNQGTSIASFVIAHELLHILLYKYLYEYHPIIRDIIESKKIWDFSEAINVIIQGQKEWTDVFEIAPKAYKEHENLCKNMSEYWDKDSDIDKLIKEFLY